MFTDRIHAANLLVKPLTKYKNCNGVILALPRGGVPLGFVLSQKLNLPLDLIMTKKIGHPAHAEYAIGSVSMQGMILDEQARGVSREYIDEEVKKLRKQMMEKMNLYDGKRKHYELKDKIVILVDDGVATGNTIFSAIEIVRSLQPEKIVVAVPIAPPETVRELEKAVDELICLSVPEDFRGVGQFYEDFSQVSDEEVIAYLKQSEKFLPIS
ncbi:MAG TPA: phosphoribosyltransferase family protein [Bacteroidia bacterium]|nr:phosphoribosyltransferase family protein [Bacteroidia bacterium]